MSAMNHRGLVYYAGDVDGDALGEALRADEISCIALTEVDSAAVPKHRLPVVFVCDTAFARGLTRQYIDEQFQRLSPYLRPQAVLIGAAEDLTSLPIPDDVVFGLLRPPVPIALLAKQVSNALALVSLTARTRNLESDLQELNEIGVALSAQRDVDDLLRVILTKSRQITSADAGSLYLVERPSEEDDERKILRFKLSQNESLDLSYEEFTMEISKESLAGYVALTGESLRLDDVYDLQPESPFQFNRSFDEGTGYRTKSMLVVPMKNTHEEILGVIQLINRRRNPDVKLENHDVVAAEVIPFTAYSVELVSSLASQAAVALDNSVLYKNIENLFEGFVTASVRAIESRDPTTSGHSQRVATLTVALAEAVTDTLIGPYADVRFNAQQLRQIRFASLLHDFGKIGVREDVLVKAKKLYDARLDLVRERFDFAKRTLESQASQRKIEYIMGGDRERIAEVFEQVDDDFTRALEAVDEYFRTVLLANEPSILETKSMSQLREIAARTYVDIYGNDQYLLLPDEVDKLSIPKGSLDANERREIESHVQHTYEFLRRIPWTRDLRRVPEIAWAHHEKLDGTGYPRGLTADAIAVESKMMTIADIFDALTASDRPYKRAVDLDRALQILTAEQNDNHVDGDLLETFIKQRLYNHVLPADRQRHA